MLSSPEPVHIDPISARILMVEDDPPVQRSISRILRAEGYDVEVAGTRRDGLEALKTRRFDLVLLDLTLPDGNGLDVLRLANEELIPTPLLVLTANRDVAVAAEAMKLGAEDFLEKPIEDSRLLVAVKNALRRFEQQKELGTLRHKVTDLEERILQDGLPGVSPAIKKVRAMVAALAPQTDPCLITGPRGSGKTRVAKLFHELSGRSGEFIAVNAAMFDPHRLEADLFGVMKGSYTDARDSRAGVIEDAAEGTLFLDEIGELDPRVQQKLLTVLRERTFRRVGENRLRKSTARIITATNKDLEAECRAGRFRHDLLDRLRPFRLYMPPLSERPDDIVYLAELFLADFCRERRLSLHRLSPDAQKALRQSAWPGNVEDLRQVTQRIVVFATSPRITRREVLEAVDDPAPSPEPAETMGTLSEEVDRLKARLIDRALKDHDGSIQRASESLDINRVTLWRYMRRFGLDGRAKDGSDHGDDRSGDAPPTC